MRIVAIDPGPEYSAWVRWDTDTHDFIGEMKMGIDQNFVLLHDLPMLTADTDMLAIEMVQSYGMGVGREVFETCMWVGRFAQRCDNGLAVKMYGRPTIKGAIGGNNDAQIRASLRMRYGDAKKGCKLEGVKKDIWSSLALATALDENIYLKEW